MRLLAFDTSTDALSIAVSQATPGGPVVQAFRGAGGAAASATLIGAVMDLLREANLQLRDLDAICFGSGPGSFTGLRTACSVAQGLAYGADRPVLPVPSLLALAQNARTQQGGGASRGCITVMLDARMDQVYAAIYAFVGSDWTCLQAPCLLAPEDVAAWSQRSVDSQPQGFHASGAEGWQAWAGNVFEAYGERLAAPPSVACIPAAPDALAILQLAPAMVLAGACVAPEQALPLYVRDKVAKTTGERALEKADKAQRLAGQLPAGGAEPINA